MRKVMMERAKAHAESNPLERTRLAAVLCKGNKVLSVGINRFEETNELLDVHPDIRQPDYCKGIHAEVAAIKPLRFQKLNGAHLYVARVKNDGSFGLAAPCETCLRHIIRKGIKKVYFTTDEGSYGVTKL